MKKDIHQLREEFIESCIRLCAFYECVVSLGSIKLESCHHNQSNELLAKYRNTSKAYFSANGLDDSDDEEDDDEDHATLPSNPEYDREMAWQGMER
jgi:hypothetical protein